MVAPCWFMSTSQMMDIYLLNERIKDLVSNNVMFPDIFKRLAVSSPKC